MFANLIRFILDLAHRASWYPPEDAVVVVAVAADAVAVGAVAVGVVVADVARRSAADGDSGRKTA